MQYQAIVNTTSEHFAKQGFPVHSVEFNQSDIKYNMYCHDVPFSIFMGKNEKSEKKWGLIHYLEEEEGDQYIYRPYVFKEGLNPEELLMFLKMLQVRYICFRAIRDIMLKMNLVQFEIENFAMDDDVPTFRFYYKELYWTLIHKGNYKWDLYEYSPTETILHLNKVSLKRFARFLNNLDYNILKPF